MDKIVSISPPVEILGDIPGPDADDDRFTRRVCMLIMYDGGNTVDHTWHEPSYQHIYNEVYVPLMKAWGNVDVPTVK